jgi:formiminotetrahydrofolate cyclodeaminase
MPDARAIRELDATGVLHSFASPAHPASSGSAAALTGAMAAALVAKAARAGGQPSYAAQAIALAVKLDRLAAKDADVLDSARSALSLVSDGGDARRSFELGQRLTTAAAVPLEIAESCADVVELASALSESAPADLQADMRGAAWLAAASARIAAHLVEVNLGVSEGDPRAERAQDAAARAARLAL